MRCSSPKEVEFAEAATEEEEEEDAAVVVVVSRTAVSIAANRQVTTVGLLACNMVSAWFDQPIHCTKVSHGEVEEEEEVYECC